MARIIVCAGVHLDRAWPELGSAAGARRREVATITLVEVVRSATELEADAIAVVGGLTSSQTVMPATLDLVATAFTSFRNPVFIVPGTADPHGPNSPYGLVDWPPNVHVLTDPDDVFELQDGVLVTGVATTTGSRPTSVSPDVHVTLVGGGADLDLASLTQMQTPLGGVVVAGGGASQVDGRVVSVGQLLGNPGAPKASAVLVGVGVDGLHAADDVPPHGSALLVASLDVSGIGSTEQLLAAVMEQAAAGAVVVGIHGVLSRSIQLPDLTEGDALGGLVLDSTALSYEMRNSVTSESGSRAEFEESLARADESPRTRHQATALGLRALEADDE